MLKTAGILGYGRFGRLWAEFLRQDFDLAVWDENQQARDRAISDGLSVEEPDKLCRREAVFLAVPISAFEDVIKNCRTLFGRDTAVIDLLSVKLHPKKVLETLLQNGQQAMLTHPMFGPDSVKIRGFEGQKIVVDRFRMKPESSDFWCGYFSRRGLCVCEMGADQHDRFAAGSQGVTHFIGRILGELDFQSTPIDTLGSQKLSEIKNQVCNDTWQLFVDLQTFNPHTLAMRAALGRAQAKIYNQLLPNRIWKDRLVVGIQGGRGSFNEEAARYYLGRSGVKQFELKYLYTTENVLKALHEGEVDRGQFAIHNSTGGIVTESVQAMSRFNFDIVEEYAIKISHALMTHPSVELFEVDRIMAHPQVFRQCRKNLSEKYSRLLQVSGEGELVDHAKVAELLGKGELPRNTATMGSKVLAEIHNLRVVEDNLQDLAENFTSFLFVERPA